MQRASRRVLIFGCLAAWTTACGADPRHEGAEVVDTTGVVRGVPAERIEQEAQAMPPEEAEALGIVDTTIHIEDLGEGDTIPLIFEP
jgi:hypothetical protein